MFTSPNESIPLVGQRKAKKEPESLTGCGIRAKEG